MTMRGFTLIELLIVIAIIGLLVGVALPSLNLLISQTNVTDAAATYAQTLRRAESLAIAGRNDSACGVHLATSSIVLFKGTSYAARDTQYDDSYTTSNFVPSGLTEISFAKFTGLPSATGDTTLTNDRGSSTKTITINAKGTILY